MITLINDLANFGRGKGDKDKRKRQVKRAGRDKVLQKLYKQVK